MEIYKISWCKNQVFLAGPCSYWKKPIQIWDVNVDNIVISKLVKIKPNSKYLIGYLDKDIRPLVLIMPTMSGYVKTFKVGDKIYKLMMRNCLKNIKLFGLRLKT